MHHIPTVLLLPALALTLAGPVSAQTQSNAQTSPSAGKADTGKADTGKADTGKADTGKATPQTAAQQGFGPIVPNRPGFTNGSATVAPGDALAENGVSVTRAQAAGGGLETLDLPETTLRIGATPNVEADLSLPDYFDAHGGDRAFGDAVIGVKYKFYQSRDGNTKASVAPGVSLPTHTVYSSGQYDPTLLLGIQTASGARWSLASNLVLTDPTAGGSRNLTTTVSGAVAYTLTPLLSAYVDAYDAVPRTGGSAPVADGGLVYLATPNLQLDAELYVGLGAAAPVRSLAGGVSFRL